MLKWTLRVIAPQFVNRLMWRNSVITHNTLKYVKTDLHLCGLDLEKLSDLPKHLKKLLDVKLEVTKKTKGDNENIFFNRRIENDRAPGQLPAGGGRRPCPVLAGDRPRSSSTRESRSLTRSIPGWRPPCGGRCRPGITPSTGLEERGRGGAEDARRFRLHGDPQRGERFREELRKLAGYRAACVVVEAASSMCCSSAIGATRIRTRCSAARCRSSSTSVSRCSSARTARRPASSCRRICSPRTRGGEYDEGSRRGPAIRGVVETVFYSGANVQRRAASDARTASL